MNCLLGDSKTSSTTASNSTSSSSNNNNNNSSSSNSKISSCNNLDISSQNFGGGHTTTTISSQETCLICGDVASGKHYGLRSCEACKAFFKRTVQGKIEYSCPATRECEINKRRRKACQACRFQKCLNMGMLKEGVRLDRVRGGRQKYRRGLSPGSGGGGVTGAGAVGCGGSGGAGAAAAHDLVGGAGGSLVSGCPGGSGGGGPQQGSANNSLSNSAAGGHQTSDHSFSLAGNTSSETNRIMTALINCEPEELTASPAQFVANLPSSLSVQMKTLYILSDLFDRELVSLIGWAKQIPGFSETITLNDQMRLLQSTWAEVIALSIGYRSHLKRIENFRQQHGGGGGSGGGSGNSSHHHHHHHHNHNFMNATPSPTSSSPASTASSYNNNNSSSSNNNCHSSYNLDTEIRLVFAKDLIIDFKHAVACGADEIFYNCVQLIKRLDYLKITPKEYIILRAISLTNADVRLENPKATHQLRDLIMDTLYEVTVSDNLTSSSSSSIISNANNNNTCGQRDNNNGLNVSSIAGTNNHHQQHHHQIKTEAQERPLSSMNQYASASPPRPSSSVPSSSSLSSVCSHNNTTQNQNNNNMSLGIDSNVTVSNHKKVIINHRLNQVLLCLPVLRQIDSCIRKFWNDVRKGPNNVPMNKLFEEMLEPCQRIYKSSAEM